MYIYIAFLVVLKKNADIRNCFIESRENFV